MNPNVCNGNGTATDNDDDDDKILYYDKPDKINKLNVKPMIKCFG